jgi:hypothetical protein
LALVTCASIAAEEAAEGGGGEVGERFAQRAISGLARTDAVKFREVFNLNGWRHVQSEW